MPATLDHPTDLPPAPEKTADSTFGRLSKRSTSAYIAVLVATLVLAPVLVLAGASQGYIQILAGIAALVALILVPWKPILGLYLVVISAVVVEQEPLLSTPIGTDRLISFIGQRNFRGCQSARLDFLFWLCCSSSLLPV